MIVRNNEDDRSSKQATNISVSDKRDKVTKETKDAVPKHKNVDAPATNISYTEEVNRRIFGNNGDMNTKVGTIIMTKKTSVRNNNIVLKDYGRIPKMINRSMDMMGINIGITPDDMLDKLTVPQ